jgi:alpha-D-ribose 1-methylphosphonate 5-triphosphate diphosphatase PhnM
LGSELAKIDSEALNLVVGINEFDADMFDENVATEPHIEEDDEAAISESDEENVHPSVDTAPDALVGTVDKGNKENMPSSSAAQCDVLKSSRIDWSSYYTIFMHVKYYYSHSCMGNSSKHERLCLDILIA